MELVEEVAVLGKLVGEQGYGLDWAAYSSVDLDTVETGLDGGFGSVDVVLDGLF